MPVPQPHPAAARCLSCHAQVGATHGSACQYGQPGGPVAEADLRFVSQIPPWLRDFSRTLADAYATDDGLSLCAHLLTDAHHATPLHMLTWAPGLMICAECASTQIPRIREEGILESALCDSCRVVPAAGLVSFESGNLTVWAGMCVRCLREHRPDAVDRLAQDANVYAQAHHAVFGLGPAPHCLGCSAALGEPHAEACEVAACLDTGRPRLLCPHPHDHGADLWTGMRRGYLEAAEIGWFANLDPVNPTGPWVAAALGDRGAFPDLNRLFDEGEWDPARLRFFPAAPLHAVVVDESHRLPNGAVLTVTTVVAQQLHHGHWHTVARPMVEQPTQADLDAAVEALLADLRAQVDADHTVAA